MNLTRHFAAAALVLLPAGSLTAQPGAAPVLTIVLSSYAYAPTPIRLAANEAVTLHFVNRAGKGHDFTAREFFAASRVLSGAVENGEVDLGAGRDASVTLVPSRGTYKVHCGRPFHKMLGMRSTIIVE